MGTEKFVKTWEKSRRKGKKYFIIKMSVIYWLATALVNLTSVFIGGDFLIRDIVTPIILYLAWFFALIKSWKISEEKYKKQTDTDLD